MDENKFIEWKEAWRDEYLKWICGFANAQGGVLEIGRDDKGKAIGAKNPLKLLKDLPNKIRDILGIIPEIDQIQEKGKNLIQIKIKPYTHPINYKGQFYYRSGSTNQELRGSALHHFLLKKMGKTWDSIFVEKGSISDLDSNAIAKFREMAVKKKRLNPEVLKEKDEDLIEKLQLAEDGKLKRAAILLFYPDPEDYFTGAYIKIGYFKNNADILYHDVIRGDLFSQVDKTVNLLLTKYLKAFISYKGLERLETYPIPEEALREAVLNAVIHKDYTTGSPIQISVYEDKIMIWNDSQFPYNWTIEKLITKHSSKPFNPDIAKVFFLSGMVEAWGRGVEKMITACKIYGVPEPVFRGETDGLWVEFKNHDAEMRKKMQKTEVLKKTPLKTTPKTPLKTTPKTPLKTTPKTPLKTTPKTPLKTTPKTPLKTTPKTPLKTTPKTPLKTTPKTPLKTPEKILSLLSINKYMTVTELMQNIDKSESAIKRAIQKLQKEGRLKRFGPDKGGHWKVVKKDNIKE